MSQLASFWDDTIVAPATAPGIGAIGVIRLSGVQSITIVSKLFIGKRLEEQASHTLHVGTIKERDELVDEVVVSLYRAPKSYTGENVVEISCHGSPYIIQRIVEACIQQGARSAFPGEFTQRAFLNGKMDLTQAEAVADIIASQSRAAQQTALNQLRGGFSKELNKLREELIHFAALIELELDFSEEDVEFADRTLLKQLIELIYQKVIQLKESFRLGNVIKSGVSVAIIGKPNAGKSTLLNALLNEERAIVSEIAGTTRDSIEEMLNIQGVLFRLIDTAGIREHSTDRIENLGIERSKHNAARADIILHVVDMMDEEEEYGFEWLTRYEGKTIVVYNKFLLWQRKMNALGINRTPISPFIDAKENFGIEELKSIIYYKAIGETVNTEATIITNARHYEALKKVENGLLIIQEGLKNKLTGDLLSLDIRYCLHSLGEITGRVEIDRDILGTIFSKFCIGK